MKCDSRGHCLLEHGVNTRPETAQLSKQISTFFDQDRVKLVLRRHDP